jgi:sugar phosphate isomerase/epimerase
MQIGTQIAGPDRALLSGAVDDLDTVLERLAEIGYDGIELTWYPTHYPEDEPFDTYYGLTPAALRDAAASHGLAITGSHLLLPQLRERFGDAVAFHRAIGCDAIGVVEAPEAAFESESGVRDVARELSTVADRLREEEMALFLHNHDHEFERTFGDRTGFDVLTAALDDSVPLQIDLSHVRRTGRDPVSLLESLGDRVRSLHASDIRGGDGADVLLGEGDLNVARALSFARERGHEWVILEEKSPRLDAEDPEEIMAVMEHDHEYLQSALDGDGAE